MSVRILLLLVLSLLISPICRCEEEAEQKANDGIFIDPEICAADQVSQNSQDRTVLFGDSGQWFASGDRTIKLDLQDLHDGVISFWIIPVSDPLTASIKHVGKGDRKGAKMSWGDKKELVWGGNPGKIATLSIAVDRDGVVSANHLSWHNKSKWLNGVTSPKGALSPGKWTQVAFGFGKQGQRLWINGKLVDQNKEGTQSISWPKVIKFRPIAAVVSDFKIQKTEDFESGKRNTPELQLPKDKGKLAKDVFSLITKLGEYKGKLASQQQKTPEMPYEVSRFNVINRLSALVFYNLLCEIYQPAPEGVDLYALHRDEGQWLLRAAKEWESRMADIASGKVVPFTTPKIGTDVKTISTKDGSFWQNGRPVYFVGLLGPNYTLTQGTGINFTGHTVGPKWEMPKEGVLKKTGVGQKKRAMQAEKHGMLWDILYSGHGFPAWVLKKHPELKVGVGFMKHDPISKHGWDVHETTLNSVLPDLKGANNILTFDLANEPAFNGATVDSLENWHKWLKSRYPTIADLNHNWETEYTDFNEIPVPDFVNRKAVAPNEQVFPVEESKLRVYVDWSRFNLERVNDWYFKVNKIVKSYLPDTFTYTKIISNAAMDARMGIDVIANARTTDLLGSDSWWVFNGYDKGKSGITDEMAGEAKKAKGDYSVRWYSLMQYDLLTSAKPEAPATNGEFHLFSGPFTPMSAKNPQPAEGHWDRPIPGNHFYAGIWLQATYGQALSDIWTHWPRNNVPERPQAFDAASRVAMDLNRLSREVTTLNRVKRPVGILWSLTSILANDNGKKSGASAWPVWSALTLNGLRPQFVLERDLVAGKVPDVKVLMVYSTKNIDPKALATLKKAKANGMKIWSAGPADNFKYDAYYHEVPEEQKPGFDLVLGPVESSAERYKQTKKTLAAEGLLPKLSVSLVDGTEWLLHWRVAELDGSRLINVCNFARTPINARVNGIDANRQVTDLITGEVFKANAVPMDVEQVRLLKINP